jgi:hypothetical protein
VHRTRPNWGSETTLPTNIYFILKRGILGIF